MSNDIPDRLLYDDFYRERYDRIIPLSLVTLILVQIVILLLNHSIPQFINSFILIMIFLFMLTLIHRIKRLPYITLPLIVGGLLVIFNLILVYSNIYFRIYIVNASSFSVLLENHNLDFFDFLYYSVTTFTSTGYGDIHPFSRSGELVASSEMLFGYFTTTVLIATLITKFMATKNTKRYTWWD